MTDQFEGPIIHDSALSGTMPIGTPPRVEAAFPVDYRLGRRNGELVLQGAYQWMEGFQNNGIEWRDIPIVELDGTQPTNEKV